MPLPDSGGGGRAGIWPFSQNYFIFMQFAKTHSPNNIFPVDEMCPKRNVRDDEGFYLT